jgi:hypothetical protein
MSKKVHLRRCHVCGEVSCDDDKLVEHCSACKKHLAPFYYFNEMLAMGLITAEVAALDYKSSAMPRKDYPAVLGISVYWDEETAFES